MPKVKAIKERLGDAADIEKLENEVFSILANFFKRYYDEGDFISMRRYKKDVYAIPYEGEEVKLHWANADQYYIKTSEYFKNYRFKLSDGKTVSFELVEASTEQNNNVSQKDKERRFFINHEKPFAEENGEFKIFFKYEPVLNKEKQVDLLKEAFELIKSKIPRDFIELLSLSPTAKNKDRTLLEKHLTDYTARNTFDYFIHKDLYGFLTRELDFYIKNEVLYIDDINTRNEQEFLKQLSKIKALKRIGEKIITFLAQIENFQKKLWLKKKMVVECNYCITLDRVPKELYTEILNNKEQIQEWIKLFCIDEIVNTGEEGIFENKAEFTDPLSIEFLEQNQFLVLDTAFFREEFKWKLISSIDNFDNKCDGLLINSENFQALSFLTNKYNKAVGIIYIDPPYNAKSSEIIYKNTFKHSAWLSLMQDRLNLSKELKFEEGVLIIAIDENEQEKFGILIDELFHDFDKTCVSIIHNPAGIQGANFSYTHEFLYFVFPQNGNFIGDTNRNDDLISPLRDWGGTSARKLAKTCFYPIIIKDNEIIDVGEVCDDNFHPAKSNIIEKDLIYVYPIDKNGIERKWVFSKNSTIKNKDQLFVKKQGDEYVIMRRKSIQKYKTVWDDKKYYANIYGSKFLSHMFGFQPFSYPKSLYATKDAINAILIKNHNYYFVLDYFAGSGTTGHAVIELNREDQRNRKYLLVEMGEYFDTVTKPRIQKAIYSKDWKDGKPVEREGISQCFKYMRLESYEDTLNNIELKKTEVQQQTLEISDKFKEGFVLNYMLDVEAEGSLLNAEWFINPFEFYLDVIKDNEKKLTKVDLIETFNYLIGVKVESYSVPKDGYAVITGSNLKNEKILIIWRDCNKHDNKALNSFLSKGKYNPLDNEFDKIYVNGDNNVENLKTGEELWKVILIEDEFKKRMFETA